jgi:hypothetical protein
VGRTGEVEGSSKNMILSHPRTHPLTQPMLGTLGSCSRKRKSYITHQRDAKTQYKDMFMQLGSQERQLSKSIARYALLGINVYNMLKRQWFVYLRVNLLEGSRRFQNAMHVTSHRFHAISYANDNRYEISSGSVKTVTARESTCSSLTAVATKRESRDSVVGLSTGYRLDDGEVGVRVPVGSRIFSTLSRPALGPTQPPIQWVRGALSPG